MPYYQVFVRGIATEIVDVEDAESWDNSVGQVREDLAAFWWQQCAGDCDGAAAGPAGTCRRLMGGRSQVLLRWSSL